MHEDSELFTIGELARRTGLSARTIRLWSYIGAVPPVARSTSGYRMFDAAAIQRLDLVHTLLQLGNLTVLVRIFLFERLSEVLARLLGQSRPPVPYCRDRRRG